MLSINNKSAIISYQIDLEIFMSKMQIKDRDSENIQQKNAYLLWKLWN